MEKMRRLLFLSLPEYLTQRCYTEEGTRYSDFFLRKSEEEFTYRVKTRKVKKLFPQLTREEFAKKLFSGEILTREVEGLLLQPSVFLSVCEAFKTLYMIEVSGDFYQIALGSSSDGRASVHRIEGHGFKSHLPETNLRISSFFLSPPLMITVLILEG